MSSELLDNTPQDESQNSNCPQTQSFESPSEQSESVWGRLIPVYANHPETSLNQVFELSEALITIGRDAKNDIYLKCPIISSKHCKLSCNRANGLTTVFLEDTSTNGTWINKKKISKKKVLLQDGCEIMLVPRAVSKKRKKLSYFFHLECGEYAKKNKRNGNSSVESKYFIIKDLGSGAFSTVKLVQDRNNNKKYALKIIDRVSWQRIKHATKRNVNLLDEVEIMKKAKHKNIVKVYEYFEEESKVNVILDFCGGGDMLEYIQKNGAYSSQKARKIFKQLIDSVDYLHSIKIAHRDLKPDNILLTDANGDNIKISDFGISREVSSICGTIIGTPLYQAPEVRNINGYNGRLSDYWSLGVILYVMLVAAPPISIQETSEKICRMSEKRTLPWYDETIPETAKDLIYSLLCVDPKQRITANGIYKHAWMNGYDSYKNYKQYNCDGKEEENTQNGEECMDMNMDMDVSIQSRKRKANFDDDGCVDSNKPPAKKQKSDPNAIQNEDLIPIHFTKSNSI